METMRKSRSAHAFFFALVAALVMFLPFLIRDGGYFIYYGDFNVQQIPFYKLAHEAVRSGDIFWSWYTDLGANFIGSYSFYLLFSPFFWLTLPFPTAFVPHLMGPLLILKTACASLTAFLFLRRFVKNQNYAVIGALLYAFSGWMDFNIFFNHFHDVAVFFPLLLLGVEKLVQEDCRGFFAAAVAINAAVNYWFFMGEVVFVVLYVLVRRTDKTWRLTLKKFLLVALESVIGLLAAAVVVLPSLLALLGNPRTGADELVTGWNIWVYWHVQRQPAILQSLFFPPDNPARPNFFPDHGAKWSSLSAWLPLFSTTGVIAYFYDRRHDWLKKILALSLVFALVPALNSLFVLLNDSYYARWFYMPILLMALATARALEHSEQDTKSFDRACKWTFLAVIVFTVMCGLSPQINNLGDVTFGLADNPRVMWIISAIAVACILFTSILMTRLRGHRRFYLITVCAVLAVSVGFNIFYIDNGQIRRPQWLIDHAIEGRDKISLPDDGFARSDAYDSTDNILMFLHLPNIQAFHSIVPVSILEFYPDVGVPRDVASRPEPEYWTLRTLLSVRWLFIEDTKYDQEPMPGFTFYANQNGFNIYENDFWLPMGFAYDKLCDLYEMEEVSVENRGALMLRAVVLEEDAIDRNSDLLARMEERDFLYFAQESVFEKNVASRRQFTVDTFDIDNRGFTATSSFDEEQFVFFSVPWERGWSARIDTGDGYRPVQIEKANLGFMAVRVPAGDATIRFDYMTPGLKAGLAVTLVAVAALVALAVYRRRTRKADFVREDVRAQRALLDGVRSYDEFVTDCPDAASRAAYLQSLLAAPGADDTAAPPQDAAADTDGEPAPPEE